MSMDRTEIGVRGNTQLRRPVDDYIESDFYAPLTDSLITTRGRGLHTYTRATAAWSFDNEGKLNLNIPSGCARFKGARFVRNLFSGTTEDLSSATWTKKDVTITSDSEVAPDGTTGMDLVIPNGSSTTHYVSKASAVGTTVGKLYTVSVYAKAGGYTLLQIAFSGSQVSGDPRINFDLSSGTITANDAGISGAITPLANGVYRVSAIVTAATTSLTPLVIFAINSLATRLQSFAGDTVSGVCVWGIQVEDVSGQADQTASEYVSVGVLSSPYHGAGTVSGADGCKWFPTNKDGSAIPSSTLEGYFAEPQRTNNCLWGRLLNIFSTGSSSSLRWLIPAGSGSSVLTNSDFSSGLTGWSTTIGSGGSITESGGVVTFVSDGGTPTYLMQSAVLTIGKTYSATVVINSGTGTLKLVTVSEITGIGVGTTTFNFIADSATIRLSRIAGVACNLLIDSFSVKEAEIQVTTTTGLDNVTNSASRLTAAATDATITQLLTAATGTGTLSAYIKRVSGTGTISLTRDGGTGWTDITSSLVTDSWVLVQMTSDVGANPTVGIKMGTSGDVIDVDCVQDENGAWATSPILTTTAAVTRNADVLSYASAFDVAQGTALCSVKSAVPINSGQTTNFLRGDSGSAALAYVTSSNSRTATASTDGTNIASVSGGDITTGIRKKLVRWGSDLRMSADGLLGSSTAFDGSMGTVGTLYIACNQSGIDHLSGPIREVHIWSTPLTDAQLQQVTR